MPKNNRRNRNKRRNRRYSGQIRLEHNNEDINTPNTTPKPSEISTNPQNNTAELAYDNDNNKRDINSQDAPENVTENEQEPKDLFDPHEEHVDQNIFTNINEETDNPEAPSKLFGFVAIIIGILLILGGFITYNYFSNTPLIDLSEQISQLQDNFDAEVDKIDDSINPDQDDSPQASEDEADYEGIIPIEGQIASGINTQRNTDEIEQGANTTNDNDSQLEETITETANQEIDSAITSQTQQLDQLYWTANDYSEGDILTGEYTVITGDTLWELAEGAYGDGTMWEVIAEANNVDFLSNGNPLIIPGQILEIPVM